MEALAQASAHIADLSSRHLLEQITQIFFFADNTGAIQRIFEGTPGLAQHCSLRFRQNILKVLDDNPNIHVTIEWVPGHKDIRGNEKADQLAKDGCD
ncbi:hypothetical protein DL93DRAFT_2107613, partial [Clavulina sp. PMI_390]